MSTESIFTCPTCEVSKKMRVSLLIKTKRQTLSGHRHILSVLISAIITYCIIDTINFNNKVMPDEILTCLLLQFLGTPSTVSVHLRNYFRTVICPHLDRSVDVLNSAIRTLYSQNLFFKTAIRLLSAAQCSALLI